MTWLALQSIVELACAFGLGVLVGWILWARREPVVTADGTAAEPITEPITEPTPEPATGPVAEPITEPTTGPVAEPATGHAAEPATGHAAAAAPTPAPPAEPVADTGAAAPDDTAPDDTAADDTAADDVAAADDLQRIEGIGPKMASALVDGGLSTYAALAEADEATITTILRERGLRFAPSLETWNHQARLLAAGDEDGFHALVDELTAGRRARARR